MIILVGLGNPGKKYLNTRHNIGFEVIDQIAKENKFPEFKLTKKFNALISENIINGKKIILAKPQTFMNNSGISIKKLIRNLKFEIQNLTVIHDDIDLPLGKIRVSKNRGSAGHKGVESIIKELGTKDFARIRIGIQSQPKWNHGPVRSTEEFVLQKFKKEEKELIKSAIQQSLTETKKLN